MSSFIVIAWITFIILRKKGKPEREKKKKNKLEAKRKNANEINISKFDLFYFKLTIPNFNSTVYIWCKKLMHNLYDKNYLGKINRINIDKYINTSIFSIELFNDVKGKKIMEQFITNSIFVTEENQVFFDEIAFYKDLSSMIIKLDPEEVMIKCLKNLRTFPTDRLAECIDKIKKLDTRRYKLEYTWHTSKQNLTSTEIKNLKEQVKLIDKKSIELKNSLPKIKQPIYKTVNRDATIDEQFLFECLSDTGYVELTNELLNVLKRRIFSLLQQNDTPPKQPPTLLSYEDIREDDFISLDRYRNTYERIETTPAGYYNDGHGNLIYRKKEDHHIGYKSYVDRYEIDLD